MEIIYKLDDSPKPGDLDLFNGIQEINKNNYRAALNHFQKGVQCNNEYAILFAAIVYYTGFDLPERDIKKSIELFKMIAIELNNPVAQFFLGVHYLFEEEAPDNDDYNCIEWLLMSVTNGWTYAKAFIGTACYIESPDKDYDVALEFFRSIVEGNDNRTDSFDDGTLYLFGNKKFELNLSRVDKNIIADVNLRLNEDFETPKVFLTEVPDRIFDWPEVQRVMFWNYVTNKKSICVSASQSFISTLHCYKYNSNAPEEKEKYFYWLKQAAKYGNASACLVMGLIHDKGYSVYMDLDEANRWFIKFLTLGGHPEFQLGMFYYLGERVKKDWKAALSYFEAATRYRKEAYFYMGDIYQQGQYGVIQNYKKAYDCYLNSFQLGNLDAANFIALLYYNGLGVEKDEEKAIEWFKESGSINCKRGSSSFNAINISEIVNDPKNCAEFYSSLWMRTFMAYLEKSYLSRFTLRINS